MSKRKRSRKARTVNTLPAPQEAPVGLPRYVTATIPAGTALSDAVSISDARKLYIMTPNAWAPAPAISFRFSLDGVEFYDLFTPSGSEFMFDMTNKLNSITPLTAIEVPTGGYLMLRSGPRDNPIAQEFERKFILAMI